MERYCSKIGKEAIDLTAVPPASVKGMPSTMWNKSPECREKGRAGDLKASQKCGCLEAQGERYSSEVLWTHTSQLPLMTHTRWEGWTKTDEQAYLTPARVSSWRMCVYTLLCGRTKQWTPFGKLSERVPISTMWWKVRGSWSVSWGNEYTTQYPFHQPIAIDGYKDHTIERLGRVANHSAIPEDPTLKHRVLDKQDWPKETRSKWG